MTQGWRSYFNSAGFSAEVPMDEAVEAARAAGVPWPLVFAQADLLRAIAAGEDYSCPLFIVCPAGRSFVTQSPYVSEGSAGLSTALVRVMSEQLRAAFDSRRERTWSNRIDDYRPMLNLVLVDVGDAMRSYLRTQWVERRRSRYFLSRIDLRGGYRASASRRTLLAERVRSAIATEYSDDIVEALRYAEQYVSVPTAVRIAESLNDRLSIDVGRADCGHWVYDSSSMHTLHNGDTVCPDCAEDECAVAEDTGELHYASHLYTHDDGLLYSYPEPDDDGDSLMGYSTDVLRYLSVDPSFKTTADGEFHMGVELETMLAEEYSVGDTVSDVRSELGEDYVVAKEDGSLDGDGNGIEWVTRPTSLATHLAKFKAWTPPAGLRAWDPGCCGMHVHIDSRAFTKGSLGRLVQFYNSDSSTALIKRVAGRHPDSSTQAQTYARRDVPAALTMTPTAALKAKGHTTRYTMINTTNLNRRESARLGNPNTSFGESNTVEIRIFRASLNKNRLLAQLEFAHASVMFARQAGIRDTGEKPFLAWLQRMGGYPHLRRFLELRPNRHGIQRAAAPLQLEEVAA